MHFFLVTLPRCVLMVFFDTLLLCVVVVYWCSLSTFYWCSFCFIVVCQCPFCALLGFVMFYYCLLALPCCVMLVFIGPLAAFCWCLLVPPCCTLLMFINTPLLHFVGVCRCPFVVFHTSTSPLHFSITWYIYIY